MAAIFLSFSVSVQWHYGALHPGDMIIELSLRVFEFYVEFTTQISFFLGLDALIMETGANLYLSFVIRHLANKWLWNLIEEICLQMQVFAETAHLTEHELTLKKSCFSVFGDPKCSHTQRIFH